MKNRESEQFIYANNDNSTNRTNSSFLHSIVPSNVTLPNEGLLQVTLLKNYPTSEMWTQIFGLLIECPQNHLGKCIPQTTVNFYTQEDILEILQDESDLNGSQDENNGNKNSHSTQKMACFWFVYFK